MSGGPSSLAIAPEHVELATTLRRWIDARRVLAESREMLEADADRLPSFWVELCELGLVSLALSEASGGSGAGLSELVIAAEALGYGCTPGPFLPTAAAAVACDRWLEQPQADIVVGSLLGDSSAAAIGLRPGDPVLSAAVASWFVLPIDTDDDTGWRWVVAERAAVEVTELPSLDATRRLGTVRLVGEPLGTLDCGPAAPVGLVALLASAEALGVAQWCVDVAAAYAAERVQFGRPIGQFQAVKHRCADMLVDLEAARALVWDAARADDDGSDGWHLALDAAASRAPSAAFRCAKDAIQTLGGIGYTWDHDAHLFLKRAAATLQLLPAPETWRRGVSGLVSSGERRNLSVELPAEAAVIRDEVRREVAEIAAAPKAEWNRLLAEGGYLAPHWPVPYGLDASPLRQLVLDEELAAAGIRRRHLGVAGWVLPTIITHGSDAQRDRFVLPTLRGELTWCQMFSEPDAGSDLASLTTRAVRVEDPHLGPGWLIAGQKVWTTMAHVAQWAICLARTDPTVARHEGIGCFLVDMTTPGIEVRPLRELTGMALFNEVFLTDVFVPDDLVVGGPTRGWECARTTLANERVSMSSGSSFGPGVAALFDLAEREGHLHRGEVIDMGVADELGGLVATAHAVAMLGVRTTLRALGGGSPGPEASVRKLLGVTLEQEVQEVGLGLLGARAAVVDGEGATWIGGFLGNRALSIAGGTSDIQRNVIAERLLGLPRDP